MRKQIYSILYIIISIFLCVNIIRFEEKEIDVLEEEEGIALLSEGEYAISPYDNIFRHYAKLYGFDWRLLSAIAHSESRFREDTSSHRGACGIMQIMPSTARNFGFSEEDLSNREVNIEIATKLLHSVRKSVSKLRPKSKRDLMAYTIASYNCGFARLLDASRLANSMGDDARHWHILSDYLIRLSDSVYYSHDTIRFGEFKEGNITVAYTNKVLHIYDKYCKKVDEYQVGKLSRKRIPASDYTNYTSLLSI